MGLGTAYVLGFRYAIEHELRAGLRDGRRLLARSRIPARLPEALAKNADLVIGSRYIPGGDTPNWTPLRKFISGGGNIFARTVLAYSRQGLHRWLSLLSHRRARTLNLDAIHAQGYAFQVEMAYNFWKSGYRVREVPIVFEDRRVGKSKMSRKIFIEGFLWVMRARFTGDKAVRRRPLLRRLVRRISRSPRPAPRPPSWSSAPAAPPSSLCYISVSACA